MKRRFKDESMQGIYEWMIALSMDRTSGLYWEGQPRRGSGLHAAFWDGYNGATKSANAVPGTMSWAAFMAGREAAKRAAKQPSIRQA